MSSDLIQKVNDLIYELGKERQVYWFSLDEKINKHLRLYDHQLPSIVSIQNIMITLFYYYIGILPFIQLPDKVFGITLEEVRMSSKLYFVLVLSIILLSLCFFGSSIDYVRKGEA